MRVCMHATDTEEGWPSIPRIYSDEIRQSGPLGDFFGNIFILNFRKYGNGRVVTIGDHATTGRLLPTSARARNVVQLYTCTFSVDYVSSALHAYLVS